MPAPPDVAAARGLWGSTRDGYRVVMKIMRAMTAVGVARTVFTQLRKPENQARIRSAIAKARRR